MQFFGRMRPPPGPVSPQQAWAAGERADAREFLRSGVLSLQW
jgi:hypothetical protein